MTAPAATRWSIHKQLLGLPSFVGVTLFVMAGLNDNWWLGFPMFLVVLVAYGFLYETCFARFEPKSVKGVLLAAALVSFQLGYWAGGFWLANSILKRTLAS